MVLDHIAVLTTSIERFCAENDLHSSEPIETFADTGSRELYIDGDASGGRLLLLQPHGAGPYQRALDKRGPGLHHLGVATDDLAAARAQWVACGWQVHPASGAFLFQRGVPTLIELFEGMTALGPLAATATLATTSVRFPALAGIRCGAETAVERGGRVLQML